MKKRFKTILAVLGLFGSIIAFSGANPSSPGDDCPLKGTPACPEYPTCCK